MRNLNNHEKAELAYIRVKIKSLAKTFFCMDNDGDLLNFYYYDTLIVQYNTSTQRIMLNAGGYLTRTTIKRMNQILETLAINASAHIFEGQLMAKLPNNEIVCTGNRAISFYEPK